MSNILRIRTLTDRFFDGETTLSEEQELYAFFSQAPEALPEDLRPLRELFVDLKAVAVPTAVQSVAMASQHTGRRRRWLVAATVAVLLVGGALTLFRRNAPSAPAEEEYVAYIYGQRTTDPAVVLGEMQLTMVAMADDGGDVVGDQLKAMFDNN